MFSIKDMKNKWHNEPVLLTDMLPLAHSLQPLTTVCSRSVVITQTYLNIFQQK